MVIAEDLIADALVGRLDPGARRLSARALPLRVRESAVLRPLAARSFSAVALALALVFATPVSAATPKTVLVLFSSTRLLPASIDADRGFRAALQSSAEQPVEVYAEFLDLPRFGGEAFVQTFSTYLDQKFAARPPDLLVAVGSDALDLMVRHREKLFPKVPIVYMGVARAFLNTLSGLPHDVVGVPVVYDFSGTVENALRWHRKAKHLVVVTGASPFDRENGEMLRRELARFSDQVELEYLSALPTEELETRLHAIPRDSVVFTLGYFMDGANRVFAPREAAERIARAANAPVYAPYDTFIGTGVVGGTVPSFEQMGHQGGEIANALLAGTAPESLKLPAQAPTRVELDWRQAARFGVRERDLPADAVLHFKEPTFWEAYRNVALVVIAVIAVQAALITALLFERARRRRTALALGESEGRLSLAARAAGLSTWSWTLDGGEHPAFEVTHPADRERLANAVRQALAAREDLNLEYRVVQPDGEVRWLAAYGRADDGPERRVVGVARDVTERKLAELSAERDRSALAHMTRVSTLGQMSAAIAHQLSQPLTAILSNAEAARQLLAREPLDMGELRAICDDIVNADHHASEVIRRLGALFKRGELELQRLDLNDLLRETLELAHTDLVIRHVPLVTELAPDLPPILGGRVQLQQIFLNLLVNAADAMSETKEEKRRLLVRTEVLSRDVRVLVTDSGQGIAPADLARLFDPFWSSKSGGMGMGLSICRSIADAHRGTLIAFNNPDAGATFCLTLPAITR